jgi:hypothetical protein
MVIDSLFNNELIKMDYHVGETLPETHHHQDLDYVHHIEHHQSVFQLGRTHLKTKRGEDAGKDSCKVGTGHSAITMPFTQSSSTTSFLC